MRYRNTLTCLLTTALYVCIFDSTLPASKWMHWATLWRHFDLFWAATSASSQVIPILDKSLLTCSSSLHADDVDPSWTRNLPVQRLSRYTLVIPSYHVCTTLNLFLLFLLVMLFWVLFHFFGLWAKLFYAIFERGNKT